MEAVRHDTQFGRTMYSVILARRGGTRAGNRLFRAEWHTAHESASEATASQRAHTRSVSRACRLLRKPGEVLPAASG